MSDVDWHNIKADECDGACSIKMNDAEPIEVATEPKKVSDPWEKSEYKHIKGKAIGILNSIKYELVDPTLPELKFATEGSVGMDLYTRQDEHIPPFAMGYKIPLNVKVDMPSEIWLMLACRSSFPMKYPGLFVANSQGIIDSDYHGEICILVSNLTSEIKFIHRGTKIAQLIAMPSVGVKYEKVQFVDPNPKHEGFGSTGV